MSVKDVFKVKQKPKVIHEKKTDSPTTLELIEKQLQKLQEQQNLTPILERIEQKLDELTKQKDEINKAQLRVLELFALALEKMQ